MDSINKQTNKSLIFHAFKTNLNNFFFTFFTVKVLVKVFVGDVFVKVVVLVDVNGLSALVRGLDAVVAETFDVALEVVVDDGFGTDLQ